MPAGNTYDEIATQLLTSDTASITFSSIPQTYTDLVLVVSAQSAGANFYMKPNADSNIRYSTTYLQGEGTVAQSGRFDAATLGGNGMLPSRGLSFPTADSVQGACIVNIMNYSNTTTFKTVLSRWGVGTVATGASVNLYQSTGAITQLQCFPFASNWTAGSTFSLYGIASA